MMTDSATSHAIANQRSRLLLLTAELEQQALASMTQRTSGDDFFLYSYQRIASTIRSRRAYELASDVQVLAEECSRHFSPGMVNDWEMAVACKAMRESLNKLDSLSLPPTIVQLIESEYEEFTRLIGGNCWELAGSLNDPTLRSLRSCFLQWIPAGVYYFEFSGIPKRNLWLCPRKDKLSLYRFLLFTMRGTRPTIEMHLPAQTNRHFTKSESELSHRLVAEVLDAQPWIRGIAGSSWYCDPIALQISPHLSFISDLFEQNGGFIHRLRKTKHADRKALLKSRTRRELFEQGKYIPTDYARYWARADVLRWADHAKMC